MTKKLLIDILAFAMEEDNTHAARAVLEWIENRVKYDPVYSLSGLSGKGSRLYWHIWCDEIGTLAPEKFAQPLLDCFDKHVGKVIDYFGYYSCDFSSGEARNIKQFIENVRADFVSMLNKCCGYR